MDNPTNTQSAQSSLSRSAEASDASQTASSRDTSPPRSKPPVTRSATAMEPLSPQQLQQLQIRRFLYPALEMRLRHRVLLEAAGRHVFERTCNWTAVVVALSLTAAGL